MIWRKVVIRIYDSRTSPELGSKDRDFIYQKILNFNPVRISKYIFLICATFLDRVSI